MEHAQDVRGLAAGQGQRLAHGGDEARREVAGSRRRLGHPALTGGGVGERDVGERPTDVDSYGARHQMTSDG